MCISLWSGIILFSAAGSAMRGAWKCRRPSLDMEHSTSLGFTSSGSSASLCNSLCSWTILPSAVSFFSSCFAVTISFLPSVLTVSAPGGTWSTSRESSKFPFPFPFHRLLRSIPLGVERRLLWIALCPRSRWWGGIWHSRCIHSILLSTSYCILCKSSWSCWWRISTSWLRLKLWISWLGWKWLERNISAKLPLELLIRLDGENQFGESIHGLADLSLAPYILCYLSRDLICSLHVVRKGGGDLYHMYN